MEDGIIAVVVLLIALGIYPGISVKAIQDNQHYMMKTLDEVLKYVKDH